jgi:transposase
LTRLEELENLVQAQSLRIEKLQQDYQKVQGYAHWLEEQLKLNKQRLYGRSSEGSEGLQLALFDEAECEPLPNADADTLDEKILVIQRRSKKRNGRKIDTSRLPRERCIHDLSADEKICGCGCAMEKIGEDVTEQIDYVPAVFKVIEHVTPKYACRPCHQIKAASRPEISPIPKSMATAGLIAEVIIEKYDYHLPLYRQAKIFLQHGADIPANTLGNWVMQGAEALLPLREALFNQINSIHVLQADETPVKILKPNQKGYFWGFHSCDPSNRFIVFEFNLSRAARIANLRLKHFQGILQTDGYSGYKELSRRSGVIAIGCWDHARRKFVEVIKVSQNETGMAGKLLTVLVK